MRSAALVVVMLGQGCLSLLSLGPRSPCAMDLDCPPGQRCDAERRVCGEGNPVSSVSSSSSSPISSSASSTGTSFGSTSSGTSSRPMSSGTSQFASSSHAPSSSASLVLSSSAPVVSSSATSAVPPSSSADVSSSSDFPSSSSSDVPSSTAAPVSSSGCTPQLIRIGRNSADDINSGEDTHIQSVSPLMTFGSEPAVVAAIDASGRSNALLRFDVGSLPTSNIVSASLVLQVTNTVGGAGTVANVHRVLQTWDAEFATWMHGVPGDEWPDPGCESSVCRSLEPIGTLDSSAPGLAVVEVPPAVIQGWIADPATRFGLLVRQDQAANRSVTIVSSEGEDGQRPSLQVYVCP